MFLKCFGVEILQDYLNWRDSTPCKWNHKMLFQQILNVLYLEIVLKNKFKKNKRTINHLRKQINIMSIFR